MINPKAKLCGEEWTFASRVEVHSSNIVILTDDGSEEAQRSSRYISGILHQYQKVDTLACKLIGDVLHIRTTGPAIAIACEGSFTVWWR